MIAANFSIEFIAMHSLFEQKTDLENLLEALRRAGLTLKPNKNGKVCLPRSQRPLPKY
jgi:hypothetical protein